MYLLLDSYAESSPTLQRLPGERAFNRAEELGLLCANRHMGAGVLVCEHMHSPSAAQHTQALTQKWSQGFRYTHQDEHFPMCADVLEMDSIHLPLR